MWHFNNGLPPSPTKREMQRHREQETKRRQKRKRTTPGPSWGVIAGEQRHEPLLARGRDGRQRPREDVVGASSVCSYPSESSTNSDASSGASSIKSVKRRLITETIRNASVNGVLFHYTPESQKPALALRASSDALASMSTPVLEKNRHRKHYSASSPTSIGPKPTKLRAVSSTDSVDMAAALHTGSPQKTSRKKLSRRIPNLATKSNSIFGVDRSVATSHGITGNSDAARSGKNSESTSVNQVSAKSLHSSISSVREEETSNISISPSTLNAPKVGPLVIDHAKGFTQFWRSALAKAAARRSKDVAAHTAQAHNLNHTSKDASTEIEGYYCLELRAIEGGHSPEIMMIQPGENDTVYRSSADHSQYRSSVREEIAELMRCNEAADAASLRTSVLHFKRSYMQKIRAQEAIEVEQLEKEDEIAVLLVGANGEGIVGSDTGKVENTSRPAESHEGTEAGGYSKSSTPPQGPQASPQVQAPDVTYSTSQSSSPDNGREAPRFFVENVTSSAATGDEHIPEPVSSRDNAKLDESPATSSPGRLPMQRRIVTADQVAQRIHYVIWKDSTKRMIQPSDVADAVALSTQECRALSPVLESGSALSAIRADSISSSIKPSVSPSSVPLSLAEIARFQCTNIIPMLLAACELVQNVKARAARVTKTHKSKGSSLNNSINDSHLTGMGHRALWHCYAVTAGIVEQSEWFEGYRQADASQRQSSFIIESNVKSLKQIGNLLSEMWSSVMSLHNDILRIDDDDRCSLEWWLGHLKVTFTTVTGHLSDCTQQSDLDFNYQ